MRARRAPARHRGLSALLLRSREWQPRATQGERTQAGGVVQAGRGLPARICQPRQRDVRGRLFDAEAREIKAEVDHYEKVRQEVKLASGDYIDLKLYEPAMRHLLDTYIRAEESEKVSAFDDLTLVQLIVERGEKAVDELPEGIRRNPEAVAETIENNVRRLIIDEMEVNPKYYEKMSELLDDLILQRRQEAMDYKAYLERIIELTRNVGRPEAEPSYPATINTAALRSLFDNLEEAHAWAWREKASRDYGPEKADDVREAMALALDSAIRLVKKADWRGEPIQGAGNPHRHQVGVGRRRGPYGEDIRAS